MFKNISCIFLLAFTLLGAGCAKTPDISESSLTTAQSVTSTLTLQINENSYSIPFRNNITVYDLMMDIKNNQDFTFAGEDYGPDMGFFVESINGIKDDTKNNLYWVYYLNDKKAETGISATTLNPNDIITWKYEPLQF